MIIHQSASYFRFGFTLFAVAGEIVGVSQPLISVCCRVEEVYVAGEHLGTHTPYMYKHSPFKLLFIQVVY